MKLPTWTEVAKKVGTKELTPLEKFIYHNEPVGVGPHWWRGRKAQEGVRWSWQSDSLVEKAGLAQG